MNWINFFFYVIVLNSLTGTVAYLLCKLLALVAKKYNAILIIYPLYRLVLLFYIVPLGCIYIRCKCFVGFGAYAIGDGFFGNQVIYEVMQFCKSCIQEKIGTRSDSVRTIPLILPV